MPESQQLVQEQFFSIRECLCYYRVLLLLHQLKWMTVEACSKFRKRRQIDTHNIWVHGLPDRRRRHPLEQWKRARWMCWTASTPLMASQTQMQEVMATCSHMKEARIDHILFFRGDIVEFGGEGPVTDSVYRASCIILFF